MALLSERFFKQLRFLPQSMTLVWTAAPRWTSAWAVLIVLQGVLPIATVYLTKVIVDNLSLAYRVSESTQEMPTDALSPALYSLAAMALILVLGALMKAIMHWVQVGQSENVQDYIKDLVHRQAIALDMSHFESPKFYDMLHRASIDAVTKPLSLVQSIGSIGQSAVTLLVMLGILTNYNGWLPVVLAVSAIPALFVVLKFSLQQHRLRMYQTARFRKAHYLSSMLTDRESAAEVRLFSLGSFFRQRYSQTRTDLRGEQISLARRQSIAEFLSALVGLVAMAASIAWASISVMRSGGSLGDLALIYQAFNQGQRLIQTLLDNIRQLYANLLFVENLFAFLALVSKLPEPILPASETVELRTAIEFKQVSFRYPNSEKLSLDDFSLLIPAGKVVAIVGENGAGKSTLIKLMTRLYDPNLGTVTVDGQDIRQMPLAKVRGLFTALFQTPVHYHQSAAENISVADWRREPSQQSIKAAAVGAGADVPIHKLPQGFETVLGKYFGGSELSGGEWQRIALARAFIRSSPVIVLDEPTSAMDSWAEIDWVDRLSSLLAGRTAVLITHRFTTAMRADIIHVMQAGKIVESGSHSELMASSGPYAYSWRRQFGSVA